MPVSDTSIESWTSDYPGDDTNTPLAGALIATTLDDEVRNIMSVVRAEAENKNWERPGLVPTFVSATIGASLLSFPGDQRVTAIIGRRAKMFLSGGVTYYGTIINSTYSAPNTTVTVIMDPIQYPSAVTFASVSSVTVAGSTSPFAAGTSCVFWNTSDHSRKLRSVRNTSVSTVNFQTDATSSTFFLWHDLDANDTLVQTQSAVLNSSLSRVDFGPFTPDLYQSGWPHSVFGGSFTITLDGTAGPFAVSFPLDDSGNPIRTHDTSYTLHVQPTNIVSGSPSSALWTVVEVTTQTNTGFQVTLGGSPTAGPVVQYDYVVMRGN